MSICSLIELDQSELQAELDLANWEIEDLKVLVNEQAKLLRLNQMAQPHTPGVSSQNQMERIKELALALRDSERDLAGARREIQTLQSRRYHA